MDYYIYAYLDPRKPSQGEFSHEPFYIGLGHGNRLFAHIKESNKLPLKISFHEMKKHRINMLKINKIRKILSVNLDPIIIKIEENLSRGEAKIREVLWISKLGRLIDCSGPLTNLTPGGECRVTSQVGPFNSFYGKTHTVEVREMLSKLHKGKILTQEQKEKISTALKGKKKSHTARESYISSMKQRAKNPEDPSIKALRISRSKTWIVQSPNLSIQEVFSLREFCKANNLNVKTLMNTLSTLKPVSKGSSAGWMIIKRL